MKAAELRLRPGEPADAQALADLWVGAWSVVGLPIDFEARRSWLPGRLELLARAGADLIVAATNSGAPVGFVTIDPRTGHLDQLCVAPAWQGSGAARLLLDAAKSRAGEAVRLEVNADNPRARSFYGREGFIETGAGVSEASGLPLVRLEWRRAQEGPPR